MVIAIRVTPGRVQVFKADGKSEDGEEVARITHTGRDTSQHDLWKLTLVMEDNWTVPDLFYREATSLLFSRLGREIGQCLDRLDAS
jgi:hypothetical protein